MTKQATKAATQAATKQAPTKGQELAESINKRTEDAQVIVGLDPDTVLTGKGKNRVTPATIEAATLAAEGKKADYDAATGTLWSELRDWYLSMEPESWADATKALTNSLRWGRAPKGSSKAEKDAWRPTPGVFKTCASILNSASKYGIAVKPGMGKTELSKLITAERKAEKAKENSEKAEGNAEQAAVEANAAAEAVDPDSELYPFFKKLAHKYGKASNEEKAQLIAQLQELVK